MGTKELLLIDHYLFKTYSVCKKLDNTLLRKEQWLWYVVSLLRKAAANAPTNLTNNDNLSDTKATLDDYLISRVRAFNDGFLPVYNR